MDKNIKKENVNPNDSDIKNLSENKNIRVVKKTVVDDRLDELYYGNTRLSDNVSRNNYPWEDKSVFEDNRYKSPDNTYVEMNYIKNNKEAKYTANTQSDLPKFKTKYKNESDRFVQIKMNTKPNLIKGSPLSSRNYITDAFIQTSTSVQSNYSSNREEVKKKVVKILKKYGLSLAQTAGIMGNMQAESSFNPESGVIDSNGLPSVGLVMFNGGSYVGAKTIDGMFAVIGKTVEQQLNYLFNAPKFKKFVRASNGINDYKMTAFLFAKIFEGCSSCVSESLFFKSKRPGFALGFYEKLNDSSSPLYWQSN